MTREDRARKCMRQRFGKRLTAFGETNAISAMLAFADAEAAAMRERAAKCATNEARADENGKAAKANALIIAAAIRALSATGEE